VTPSVQPHSLIRRFSSVSDRFIEFLEKYKDGVIPKEKEGTVENVIRGMTYLKIKVRTLGFANLTVDIPYGRVGRVCRVSGKSRKVFPADREHQSKVRLYGIIQSTHIACRRGNSLALHVF